MKLLYKVADRMLRLFVPSLTASAHTCPSPGWWHGVEYEPCGTAYAGIRFRHYCCFSPLGCTYQPWSPCYY